MEIILGFIFGLWHFGAKTTDQFENALAKDVAVKLNSPGANITVHTQFTGLISSFAGDLDRVTIYGRNFETQAFNINVDPSRTKTGRIKELNLVFDNFKYKNLFVSNLTAQVNNCRYDLGMAQRHRKIEISAAPPGVGTVSISAQALEDFILIKYPNVRTIKLRLINDKLFAEGTAEFFRVQRNFWIVSRVKCTDGRRVMLEGPRVMLDGVVANAAITAGVVATINPVIDLEKDLDLAKFAQIETIALQKDVLTAGARITLPVKEVPLPPLVQL